MRRIGALLLCFCLLLSGCGKVESPPAPAEVPAQTVPVEIPEGAPPIEEKQEAALPPPVEELPPIGEKASAEEGPVPQEEPAAQGCTVSISCAAAVEHPALDPAVKALLPQDGWILPPTQTELLEGETVFDVLLRLTQQNGISVESVPSAFGAVYVEGIGHLYEFACGTESGWIYKVGGISPNVGSGGYTVQSGEVIAWEYVVERT